MCDDNNNYYFSASPVFFLTVGSLFALLETSLVVARRILLWKCPIKWLVTTIAGLSRFFCPEKFSFFVANGLCPYPYIIACFILLSHTYLFSFFVHFLNFPDTGLSHCSSRSEFVSVICWKRYFVWFPFFPPPLRPINHHIGPRTALNMIIWLTWVLNGSL